MWARSLSKVSAAVNEASASTAKLKTSASTVCLARNGLESPGGERAGGGKQNWSHCGEEEVTLFLLWQEMQTNVLPDHLLSREWNILWPLPYEHFSSRELVNMFFTLNIYLYLPELMVVYQKEKKSTFLLYFIMYCGFVRDDGFLLKYAHICTSVCNRLNLISLILPKEVKYQRLTILTLASLTAFRS